MIRRSFFATFLTALLGARFARWFAGENYDVVVEVDGYKVTYEISAVDGESFHRSLESHFLNGTGTGTPRGLVQPGDVMLP